MSTLGQFITPEDTWNAFTDARPMMRHWASVRRMHVREQALAHREVEVIDWSVDLIEDETGDQFTLTHKGFLAALRIVGGHDRPEFEVERSIVDAVREALRAESHEAATDALVQLDCVGFDVIVQAATLDSVIYG